MAASRKRHLLPVIIVSQFAGTSLWFAGNAVVDQINPAIDHALITSAVQIGFIAGTLLFALFNIADRFKSTTVFFVSACIAAASNLAIGPFGQQEVLLLTFRFVTGFFLAGIYPVGMKIAADHFPEKLGNALGFLVGALVFGTAFPHFVRSQLEGLNWQLVLLITSLLAILGGLLVLFLVPARTTMTNKTKPDFLAAFKVFRSAPFRSAAFGYFGHMWELYAFWSVLPAVFTYANEVSGTSFNIYQQSFLVIAVGGIGCILGGIVSRSTGSKPVAFYTLAISGACCLISPLVFREGTFLFQSLFLLWGITVTADSPQFSALVAKNTVTEYKGTALTIVTSIGFAITIISIQLLKSAFENYREYGLWLLAIGPIVGLLALKKPT